MRNFLLLVCALAIAAGAWGAQKKVTLTGILIDKACSKDPKTVPAKHDKDCALMDDCLKSGYGVVTADGKFTPFDTMGSKTALGWLNSTKAKSNLKVIVTGTTDGGVMKVESIEGPVK